MLSRKFLFWNDCQGSLSAVGVTVLESCTTEVAKRKLEVFEKWTSMSNNINWSILSPFVVNRFLAPCSVLDGINYM